jgi:hypothetical protein
MKRKIKVSHLAVLFLASFLCTGAGFGSASVDIWARGPSGSLRPIQTDESGIIKTQYTNSAVAVGEVAGSATAAVFPTVTAKLVMFKAVKSNAGNVYIGIASVTKVDGTTDTTTGLELGPGESTGWIPASNLNLFYRICDNAGDDITYMVVQ